jgi:hypothetical protein
VISFGLGTGAGLRCVVVATHQSLAFFVFLASLLVAPRLYCVDYAAIATVWVANVPQLHAWTRSLLPVGLLTHHASGVLSSHQTALDLM